MNNNVLIPLDNILRILDLGFNSAKNPYLHPDRRLDFNVFLYVSEGQMEVLEEDKVFIVNKGQYLFLKSGLHHWGENKTPAGTSWYWIHFFNPVIPEFYTELNPTVTCFNPLSVSNEEYNKYVVLPKQGNILHTKVFEKDLDIMISKFVSSDPFRAISLSLHSVELFLSVFRESCGVKIKTKSSRTVQKIIEYLENKKFYNLNSKEMEAQLNLNYSYICEAFKIKTGNTIHMYNSKIFVGKAIVLIQETNMNISEISDLLGFKNSFYFSRVFKKVIGCSPSEYINRIYKDNSQ